MTPSLKFCTKVFICALISTHFVSISIGTFRLEYEYVIEYEYDFSNLVRML